MGHVPGEHRLLGFIGANNDRALRAAPDGQDQRRRPGDQEQSRALAALAADLRAGPKVRST